MRPEPSILRASLALPLFGVILTGIFHKFPADFNPWIMYGVFLACMGGAHLCLHS